MAWCMGKRLLSISHQSHLFKSSPDQQWVKCYYPKVAQCPTWNELVFSVHSPSKLVIPVSSLPTEIKDWISTFSLALPNTVVLFFSPSLLLQSCSCQVIISYAYSKSIKGMSLVNSLGVPSTLLIGVLTQYHNLGEILSIQTKTCLGRNARKQFLFFLIEISKLF